MNASIWVRRWAELTPERPALIEPATGRREGWRQLDASVDAAARRLLETGNISSGDRVAVLSGSRAEVFHLALACMRLGAVFTPLNWRLHRAELEVILGGCQPTILAHDTRFSLVADQLRAAHPGLALLDLDAAPSPPTPSLEPLPQAPEDPDHPAMILYTSGTTGAPKGVILPHRQLLFNALNTLHTCDLRPGDRALAFLPLFHTGGLNCLALPCFYRGAAVVLMDRFEPQAAIEVMGSEGITLTIAVPTMYRAMLDAGLPPQHELPDLRLLLCGGAPCPPSLLRAWRARGYALRQGYGLTEAGPNCFTLGPLEEGERLTSVGQLALHGRARLVDEAGTEVPPGAVGELQLAGPHVTAGYFGDPQATAAALRGGWLSTGDLMRRDAEGFYFVVGRRKEMFISGGENVYPAEVEAALLSHPAVGDACVVGVPDARWGEVGLAAVELAPGQRVEAEALRDHCRQRLAGYKVPRHVHLWEALPRTATGKVIRAEVAARWAGDGAGS